MTESKFIRIVEDACESALVDVGFKRLRRGTIIWEISPSFWGWVGLNRGIHGDSVRINPFVGIHAVDVMTLSAQLDEVKYVKGAYATYAKHLGEFLPDEPTFEFPCGDAVSDESVRLAKSVADAGLHYMLSIASYEALLPLIESRMPSLGGYPERYAVALYISGKEALARNFVMGVLNREGDLARFSSNSFAKFGANFLRICQRG